MDVLETIRESPTAANFTPLQEHQSHTPESFFTGKPVLHFNAPKAKLVASGGQTSTLPFFVSSTSTAAVNGHSAGGQIILDNVDVWVTSDKLLLYRESASTGLSVPYKNITLHATLQSRPPWSESTEEQACLWMQIAASRETDEEEDDSNSLDLHVYLDSTLPLNGQALTPETAPNQQQSVQALYDAVSACANLHPDTPSEGSDAMQFADGIGGDGNLEGSIGYEAGLIIPGNNAGAGALPPPFPGSSGWITAENANEYFDEDGNWREGLGSGAGTVRRHDDEPDGEAEASGDQNGEDGANGTETKWRRTA